MRIYSVYINTFTYIYIYSVCVYEYPSLCFHVCSCISTLRVGIIFGGVSTSQGPSISLSRCLTNAY